MKIARSITRNEEGIGCIFMDETIVEPAAREGMAEVVLKPGMSHSLE